MNLIALHRIERKGGPVTPGATFVESNAKEAAWLVAAGAAVAAPEQPVVAPAPAVVPVVAAKGTKK